MGSGLLHELKAPAHFLLWPPQCFPIRIVYERRVVTRPVVATAGFAVVFRAGLQGRLVESFDLVATARLEGEVRRYDRVLLLIQKSVSASTSEGKLRASESWRVGVPCNRASHTPKFRRRDRPEYGARNSCARGNMHIRTTQYLPDFARPENRFQVLRVERLVEPRLDGGNIRRDNALAKAG
jgi:hypothetical protein